MYHKIKTFLPLFFIQSIFMFSLLLPVNTQAQTLCDAQDRPCILKELQSETAKIDNQSWKDQTYRELAKTYAFDGFFDDAVALIGTIETPDTKAMTIRGIGMTIAEQNHTVEEFNHMFGILRQESEKITHPASYAIALTYIAMSQAFAGDNDGAWKTADAMENDALRYKAFAETAEIQAEKKDYKSAKISIGKIDSESFRNKAYSIVSGILADNALYNDAYNAAISITNPYKKAQAMQYILDSQKPRDIR